MTDHPQFSVPSPQRGLDITRIGYFIAGVLLALSFESPGAGLELNQHGIKELGHGFAGTAALLEDASALAHNPAGLVALEQRQFSGALTALHASIDYNAQVVREQIENEYGLEPTLVQGPDRGRSRDLTAIPALYYSHPINDEAAVGIGVYAAFGSASEFPDDWAGRFHAIGTEQSALNINPSFAFQASDNLALGMGVIIQFYEAELTNRVDVSYLAAQSVIEGVEEAEGRGAAEDVARDALESLSRDQTLDISNRIKLDSIAFGFSLGLLWEPRPETRIGVNFRSRTKHRATGEAIRPELATQTLRDQYLDNLAEAIDRLTQVGFEQAREASQPAVDERGARGGPVSTQITLPEIATLSVQQGLGERWDLLGSLTWVNWSLLDEVRLAHPDSSPRGGTDITGTGDDVRRRDLVQPLGFKDSYRVGLGARYQFDERLVLRAGASYDQSPIPDASVRTPRGPDNDRMITGLGLSYAMTANLGLDIAYARIRIRKGSVNARENPSGTGHRASGTSRGRIDNLGMQFNYRF